MQWQAHAIGLPQQRAEECSSSSRAAQHRLNPAHVVHRPVPLISSFHSDPKQTSYVAANGRPWLVSITIALTTHCHIRTVWIRRGTHRLHSSHSKRLSAIIDGFIFYLVINEELDIELPCNGRPVGSPYYVEGMLFIRRESKRVTLEIIEKMARAI